MEKHDKPTEDILFLACTRPAMIAGVPVEAMGLNVMATLITFILTSNIFLISLGPAAHFIIKEVLKNDHNKIRVFLAWQKTRIFAKNSRIWGGASLSPLRLIRNYEEL
ncbi:type IV secretion system protein VirB3 [Bartonella sp. CB169]|uniref:type IV secretion system protein VirB3 n=1 Tax=Bartonella sp. CB169 TaxID=3112257 RepID=UPI00300E6146